MTLSPEQLNSVNPKPPIKKRIRMRVDPDGTITMLYTEAFDLKQLGHLTVTRASHVEYDNDLSGWIVSFPDGTRLPILFQSRDEALSAEVEHLSARLGRLPREKGEIGDKPWR